MYISNIYKYIFAVNVYGINQLKSRPISTYKKYKVLLFENDLA